MWSITMATITESQHSSLGQNRKKPRIQLVAGLQAVTCSLLLCEIYRDNTFKLQQSQNDSGDFREIRDIWIIDQTWKQTIVRLLKNVIQTKSRNVLTSRVITVKRIQSNIHIILSNTANACMLFNLLIWQTAVPLSSIFRIKLSHLTFEKKNVLDNWHWIK